MAAVRSNDGRWDEALGVKVKGANLWMLEFHLRCGSSNLMPFEFRGDEVDGLQIVESRSVLTLSAFLYL